MRNMPDQAPHLQCVSFSGLGLSWLVKLYEAIPAIQDILYTFTSALAENTWYIARDTTSVPHLDGSISDFSNMPPRTMKLAIGNR